MKKPTYDSWDDPPSSHLSTSAFPISLGQKTAIATPRNSLGKSTSPIRSCVTRCVGQRGNVPSPRNCQKKTGWWFQYMVSIWFIYGYNMDNIWIIYGTYLVGGCCSTPLKNMKVNWDDDIPNLWENKLSRQETPNSGGWEKYTRLVVVMMMTMTHR